MFSLKIDGREFRGFQNLKLPISYGAIGSTFSFDVVFDPDRKELRSLFEPYSFKSCQVFIDDTLMLTGVIIKHTAPIESSGKLVSVGGYSKTGILQDSSIALDSYPLEYIGQSTNAIAKKIIDPFGLELVSTDPLANQAIEKITATPTDSPASFLSKLCAQQNLTLSHNELGQVVISRPKMTTPITITNAPASISYDGQKVNTPLTVMAQADKDTENSQESQLEGISQIFKPLTKTISSGTVGDAVKNVLAQQHRSTILNISLSSWFIGNKIASVGSIIQLKEDRLMLYDPTQFFIESTTFSGDSDKQVCSITCVPKEAYGL